MKITIWVVVFFINNHHVMRCECRDWRLWICNGPDESPALMATSTAMKECSASLKPLRFTQQAEAQDR
jgi:hypothetical protein